MTETELRLIAALAIIGLRRTPNAGYSTPAATGTPAQKSSKPVSKLDKKSVRLAGRLY